jgi:hypothetical protein
VTAYVVDDAAVLAGLAAGAESQRREFSRFLNDAHNGGPSLHVPALCLAAVAGVMPTAADHVAILVAEASGEAIDIPGLAAGQVGPIMAEFPGLGLAAAHAASEAISREAILITTQAARYADVPVDVTEL